MLLVPLLMTLGFELLLWPAYILVTPVLPGAWTILRRLYARSFARLIAPGSSLAPSPLRCHSLLVLILTVFW